MNVYVISLIGGFMALVGFEPGSDDPESDTLSTRPPRRDGYSALVIRFCLIPTMDWYWLDPMDLPGSSCSELRRGSQAPARHLLPRMHVVSLIGGFMALVGFEPGPDDPKHDTLSTRPPRRDSRGALVDHFVLFPHGGLILKFEDHSAIVERHCVCRAGDAPAAFSRAAQHDAGVRSGPQRAA